MRVILERRATCDVLHHPHPRPLPEYRARERLSRVVNIVNIVGASLRPEVNFPA